MRRFDLPDAPLRLEPPDYGFQTGRGLIENAARCCTWLHASSKPSCRPGCQRFTVETCCRAETSLACNTNTIMGQVPHPIILYPTIPRVWTVAFKAADRFGIFSSPLHCTVLGTMLEVA